MSLQVRNTLPLIWDLLERPKGKPRELMLRVDNFVLLWRSVISYKVHETYMNKVNVRCTRIEHTDESSGCGDVWLTHPLTEAWLVSDPIDQLRGPTRIAEGIYVGHSLSQITSFSAPIRHCTLLNFTTFHEMYRPEL